MIFEIYDLHSHKREFTEYIWGCIDEKALIKAFQSNYIDLETIVELKIIGDNIEIEWGNQFSSFPSLRRLTLVGNEQVRLNCYNFEHSSISYVSIVAKNIWFNDGSFANADTLLSVNISGHILDGHCEGGMAELLFKNCVNLKHIRGFYQGTRLMPAVFENCKSLEYPLDFRVRELGYRTFSECSSLKQIVMHNGLQNLGYQAFVNCTSLEDIYIPDSVQSLGSETFSGCVNLKTIHLPEEIIVIPKNFLKDCRSLGKCFLPNSISKIEESAFEGCVSLQSPFIPNNMKKIEKNAFKGCVSIRSIYLPESIEFIGEGAFEDCPQLVIKGTKGTYAEQYAIEHSIEFVID